MSTLRAIRHNYKVMSRVVERADATEPSMEIVYRELFLRDLAAAGLRDVYYPVGGAANHGLLYLITRCFTEFPIANALELGAGQTTLLIDALRKSVRPDSRVTTVEHDPDWAGHIGAQVSHSVTVATLVGKQVDGRAIDHYRSPFFDPSTRYDLVIVDAPIASDHHNAYNRLGAIEIVDENLADDFVIIIDDAQRVGEARLAELVGERLAALGRKASRGVVTAGKRQILYAGGSYRRAAFF